jgi:hypothetical protein
LEHLRQLLRRQLGFRQVKRGERVRRERVSIEVLKRSRGRSGKMQAIIAMSGSSGNRSIKMTKANSVAKVLADLKCQRRVWDEPGWWRGSASA